MYTDTMQQVYSSVTKVLVDSRQGNSLLYLPLDKLMQQAGAAAEVAPSQAAIAPALPATPAAIPGDSRARDNSRSRERETR